MPVTANLEPGPQDHEQWMRRALALADRAGNEQEVPVGAVVVRDGQLLGEGWNQVISSSDPTAHAEIVAIRDATRMAGNYRLPGAILYVTLEPCTMCVGALVHARVGRLVYGANEPKTGAIESAQQLFETGKFNHQPEVEGGVLAAESSALLTRFFERKRTAKK